MPSYPPLPVPWVFFPFRCQVPVSGYVLWQAAYTYVTEGTGRLAEELRQDKSLQTSMRWLTTKATQTSIVVAAQQFCRVTGMMGR